MIPTLFAIMLINFVVIHIAPGGPVEQVIAELSGIGGDITERVSRSGSGETLEQVRSQSGVLGTQSGSSKYRGAQWP